jgi:ABC-type transport system involved in multi-copper enzyme maturation permease subunit
VDVTEARLWQMVTALDWVGLLDVVQRTRVTGMEFYMQGVVVMLIAGLVIGIRCSGAVTGEREKQTWEALLLTPLTNQQILRGKLWGIAGASVPYLIAYAIPAVSLALLAGPASFFWTLLWLGVTVLAIFYVAAAGIWCSVRAKSSWQSLLNTLAFTYLGGFILACVLSTVSSILAVFFFALLALTDEMLQRYFGISLGVAGAASGFIHAWSLSFCLVLAGAFALLSWMLIRNAEYRVGILERTKHWKNEPRYTYRRRRRRRIEADW